MALEKHPYVKPFKDKPLNSVDMDLKEVYFLIMHFLSTSPCQTSYAHLWNELVEHQLLPRRYHSWYSRNGDPTDPSFPLGYNKLIERYPHIEPDHLVKLLKQLILNTTGGINVPTLLGTGSFSLLHHDRFCNNVKGPPIYMRWPHSKADQVRGLALREIDGGFGRHHRGPSIRAACYAIAKPSTMVKKMHNIKKLRGHRNAVYCAVFDRSGRYVITGSDDRLVKIWSMETAYCLASCRGHEGDITDLAVSSNNALVASSSNDCVIRVWRLADGLPLSVLRGHTGAVTAITFCPRPGSVYQLLSSSDDGTCRIWDATKSQASPRVFSPRPSESLAGMSNASSSNTGPQTCQIFCCAFNANGSIFVTGSSDKLARVWHASRPNTDDSDQPNHELDVLSGHENDVNYVQFSGCAAVCKSSPADTSKEDNLPKFKNSWFTQENIVTCSRDGSAIIWVPRTRRSHGKTVRWIRAYHLKVPPPPMPAQPPKGPRQRIHPTPRGVNMITWSLDNRFVLAAIMDCRICVWNAADGSLVHSLAGHTGSTYVLDVHPFNPRIAMSAGYDGKTIVWDIWEGTPIKIYEISPFKLIDGKFSPDGTSIILSDDVGQLYILNTGQGESQMDAKYDQFFLGDYRPLIQDTLGNILDKETQLPPYLRNIQDLLCDSAMLPYPEPYQNLYQRRRLGALGIEWRPSSLRLVVGTDIALDQEYQMLPIVDLDMLADPLPEFTHAMDWEPEVQVQSDDADSEYNISEGRSSREDQGSVSSSSPGDLDCTDEDSDAENTQKDILRRSKRKTVKNDTEIMTSSGRRVKRRNLDECDESSIKNHVTKRSSGKKVRRKKSSISKSSRPQRVAARNALTLFSRISGRQTDREDEDVWSDESSGTDSMLPDTNAESADSDEALTNKQTKHVKGKEVSLDEAEDVMKPQERPESHTNGGNRRLLIKFSLRDSTKNGPCRSPISNCDNREDLKGFPSNDAFVEPCEANCHEIVNGKRLLSEKVESQLDLSVRCKDEEIQWGGFKARTPKRMRIGDALPSDTCVVSSKIIISHNQSLEEYQNPKDLHGAAEGEETRCPRRCIVEIPIACQLAVEDISADDPHKKLRCRLTRSNFADDATRNGSCEILSESPYQNQILENNKTSSDISDHVLHNNNVETQSHSGAELVSRASGPSSSSSKKMFDAVYRRSRTRRVKSNLEVETSVIEESKSNARDLGVTTGLENSESKINGSGRTRSQSRNPRSPLRDRCEEIEQTRPPNSSLLVGLRSTRNRRGSINTIDKKTRKKSWLLLTEHEGSRYIPQLGDEVAYLIQGHQGYMEFSSSKDTGPWLSITSKIKDVEFCKVVGLAYDYVPGSGESCCKMTIKFVDPVSSVFGATFKLTLPEINSFPDFLVERSRFDAAMNRKWTYRDKCQVWWQNADEEDGEWWEGRVVSVKAKCEEFPDSPWERYAVKYKSDPTETHYHSPWELHSPDTEWEQPPGIDDRMREKLVGCLEKLEMSGNRTQDQYGVNKLKQVSDKTSFRNRCPVPLSLEMIHLRLEKKYYRSMEALKHDISVMLSAAESYFEKNAELSPKMRRLSEWFTRTLASSSL